MQIVIEIPDVPIEDYRDLFYKIHGMAASEGLFDDKKKSQRALALKAVLDILGGITNGIPLDKIRAEILLRDKNVKDVRTDGHCFFTAEEILGIIDKYKAESEDEG